MATPSISIVIATASRPAALAETVRSLLQVGVPESWRVEFLLVENGARLGAEMLLEAFPAGRFSAVRYFHESSPGKSKALNLALSRAAGDVLLFTDDDVRFPADWIRRMCEPIVAGNADAVAGGVTIAPHLLRPWMNHSHRAWLASTADYLSAEDPSEMCGANMALSRLVFDVVGGFDPELGPGITGGGEESLLTWQLKKAGFRLQGALDVLVEHHPDSARLTYRNWIDFARQQGRIRAYLMHHWHHQTLRWPNLRRHFFQAKLRIRRALSPKRNPEDEGIACWELSYIEDVSKCVHYLRERNRSRNYAVAGVRKACLNCRLS